MSFDSAEKSIQDSNLADLYVLTLGGTTYRYTSAAEDIVYLANTYTAISIHRSSYGSSAQDKQPEMIVTLDAMSGYVLAQINGVPSQSSTCTIMRLQITEAVAINIWIGECGPVAIEEDEATFRVACSLDDPVTTSVPSAFCQKLCNHVFMDLMCTIAEVSHKLDTTITAVSGHDIIVASVTGVTGKLTSGGRVRVGTEERMIVKESGTTLTLLAPFPPASVATLPVACRLIKGCAHTILACRDDYANVDHFGGLPYLDYKNPFQNALAWLVATT